MPPRPATSKQLRYLRLLADRTGTTFAPPRTSQEAGEMIDEMRARRRAERGEITRARSAVSHDMATRRGDAARVRPHELSGYGAHASWATEVEGPEVVNCRGGNGDYDVYVGRLPAPVGAPGPGSDGFWGNPFRSGRDGTRAQVIEMYERWLLAQPQMLSRLAELRGKKLGFTLAEIVDLIGGKGAIETPVLEEQLQPQQIVNQISHLESQRDEIESAIQRLRATYNRLSQGAAA